MTSIVSAPLSAEQRAAIRRIDAFRQRFGDGHFYLACHAALPLALNPDLLYYLWVNFQQDIHQELLDIPWIAVSDLILSSLCEEVGYEIYEMDASIQSELLQQLQYDSRFGPKRIRELADFVMAYVEQELDSSDLDVRDLAEAQKWRALAYKNPREAAHEIAFTLSQLNLEDKTEWIRIASLLETLTEPLFEFQSLLTYAFEMKQLVRGRSQSEGLELKGTTANGRQFQVSGVILSIPRQLEEGLSQTLRKATYINWLWSASSALSLIITSVIFSNISSRLLAGGIDWSGAVSIITQLVLSMLVFAINFTKAGKKTVKQTLDRMKISSKFLQEASTLSSFLLLLCAVGLQFSLPYLSSLYNSYGLEKYKEGNSSNSETLFKKALQLNPDNSAVHFNLGLLYEDKQDLARAREQYTLAVQAGSPQAYNNLARLLILDKDYSGAVSLLSRGLTLLNLDDNTKSIMLKNLGWARLEQRMYSEAAVNLQESIDLQRNQTLDGASAHCLLAQVLDAERDYRSALNEWQNCITYGNQVIPEEATWIKLAQHRLQELKLKLKTPEISIDSNS